MPVKKKPSAAQLAARAKFVKMVRAKAAAKKASAKKIIRKPSKIDDLLLLDEIKGRAKKAAAKKVAGLDKVVRKGKKTSVYYSRVSGIQKTIAGLQRNYLAIYETSNKIVSDAVFKASSLQEAKRFAQFHKKQTPEISKHKNVRVKVKLYK